MRWIVLSLVLVGMFSSEVFAADSDQSEMRFMRNYDAKIKALENYTVTFVEPGQKVSVPERQKSKDGFDVKLIAKKKS